ncbi:MAG: nitrate reductase [Proteobacteria bacterium]|nr:nitrate reductase [Pseudomonadota bacterium]
MIIPYIVAYLAIVIFIVAVIARVIMWAKMPIHVRWELYPVAHEAKRAHYGGSYLEESEWWKKPREVSLFGELKVMIPEILFLVAVKEHNAKLWTRTFPFHFGLYMVIGCTVLMMLSGVLNAFAPAAVAGWLGTTLYNLILVTGWAGLCLGIFGALGLLQRRLTDPALKDFTAPADIFNLVFFIVAFGSALLTAILVDPDFAVISGFVTGLVSFNTATLTGSGLASILPIVTIMLLSLLVVYIPLTHMSHFVGKYFAYHAIRWNDTPNLPGGPEEAKIGQVLNQKVTWAADHIKGEGKKSWGDLATESFKKEPKK